MKFGGIAVGLPAQTIFSWATFLNGREMNLNFVSVLLNVELLERLGGCGGSLWPIRGNIRDSHIIPSPEHTIAILLPSQGVLLLVQKSAKIKPFSEEKRDELNIFSSGHAAFFNLFYSFLAGC